MLSRSAAARERRRGGRSRALSNTYYPCHLYLARRLVPSAAGTRGLSRVLGALPSNKTTKRETLPRAKNRQIEGLYLSYLRSLDEGCETAQGIGYRCGNNDLSRLLDVLSDARIE
ncbi:hypothetical protein EVAR_37032_1 [Eumeta japonica]|uniref:Uncharacterized protein n=1 Tax=Eumeta variegata TaxID=151549 RepID=A0A4C1WHV0_EUMVA|nr:hypothetical protein EVAR_37032_1 [Eumeta japonica]